MSRKRPSPTRAVPLFSGRQQGLVKTDGRGNQTVIPFTGDPTTFVAGDGSFQTPGAGITASGFYLDDGGQKYAPVFPVTQPVDGDYAWVNQGGASVDTTNGGIYLSGPANGSTDWRIRKKAVTAPYVYTVGFIPDLMRSGAQRCAILWRESGSGSLVTAELTFNGAPGTPTVSVNKWTSPAAFSAAYVNFLNYTPFGPLHWIRLVDDNTDRKVYISFDGAHWRLVHTVGRTDFMTANEVGFGVDPNDASYFAAMTVISTGA